MIPRKGIEEIFEVSSNPKTKKMSFGDFVKMVVSDNGIFDVTDKVVLEIQKSYYP